MPKCRVVHHKFNCIRTEAGAPRFILACLRMSHRRLINNWCVYDQAKEDEMDRVCSTNWREEECM
jgi:hypothetical protein